MPDPVVIVYGLAVDPKNWTGHRSRDESREEEQAASAPSVGTGQQVGQESEEDPCKINDRQMPGEKRDTDGKSECRGPSRGAKSVSSNDASQRDSVGTCRHPIQAIINDGSGFRTPGTRERDKEAHRKPGRQVRSRH